MPNWDWVEQDWREVTITGTHTSPSNWEKYNQEVYFNVQQRIEAEKAFATAFKEHMDKQQAIEEYPLFFWKETCVFNSP